jgi:hypothetical protein
MVIALLICFLLDAVLVKLLPQPKNQAVAN